MSARPNFSSVPGPFIAIASDNSWARSYDSQAQLLDDSVDAMEDFPLGQEFYDAQGHRMAPVFGCSWKLEGLVVSRAQAQPTEVVERLCDVVDRARRFIEDNPDEFPEPADSDLPDLRSADVATCIAAFADEPLADGATDRDTASTGPAMATARTRRKSRIRAVLCKAVKKKCR